MITFVLTTSVIGVLDHVARLAADIIRSNLSTTRRAEKMIFQEGNLYTIVLWITILFGVTILLGADIHSSFTLLSITGSLSICVMFLYSFFVLILHWKLQLQVEAADERFLKINPFRMSKWRKIVLIGATAFYGILSFYVIRSWVFDII